MARRRPGRNRAFSVARGPGRRYEGGDALACYSPLNAWKGPEGITFDSKSGYYDMPLQLRCGQCIGCRLKRRQDWTIRAMHEAQLAPESCFLTLTYDEEHLPDDHSLDKQHWQKFIKRLRKKHGAIRYLHCGEYGGETLRPHYHALLFGNSFALDSVPLSSLAGHAASQHNNLRVSETLAQLWPYGMHTVGPVTVETARYVAGYTVKKQTNATSVERVDPTTGEVWEVAPEYATMSRNKGLGYEWLKRFHTDVYPSDEVIMGGKKHLTPDYYDELMQEWDPELMGKVKEKRRKRIKDQAWNHTQDRLDVREEIASRKLHEQLHEQL